MESFKHEYQQPPLGRRRSQVSEKGCGGVTLAGCCAVVARSSLAFGGCGCLVAVTAHRPTHLLRWSAWREADAENVNESTGTYYLVC